MIASAAILTRHKTAFLKRSVIGKRANAVLAKPHVGIKDVVRQAKNAVEAIAN